MPPQTGVIPRIRIGGRWINVLWLIPLSFVVLLLAIAVAQHLRSVPAVQAFISQYPGTTPAARAVYSGFPPWLRIQHFLNLFFMIFIMRSGIQILADHPRLYWRRDSTPGSEWFRFQQELPKDRAWTSKDDSVTIPSWLGIPGVRHSVGIARWWHFGFDLLWLFNGVIYFVLMFATDQWQRMVPTTWAVFPNALSTAIQYLSLQFPPDVSWTNYNSLQQLIYFVTVFVAAPLALLSGLMQSPAIANKLGWIARLCNRQAMRTVHFAVLCWFVLFICLHVTLVFVTGLRQNLNYMFAGVNDSSWSGLFLFAVGMSIVIAAWRAASPLTIKYARSVQRTGQAALEPFTRLLKLGDPRTQYRAQDISPYFWVNGTLPSSSEFDAIVADNFSSYRLRIAGLVRVPREFSYADLKALPRQQQITEHFCIQGWSGVAKWAGVSMRHILDIVQPAADARYAVFYSFADGAHGGRYYDVHNIENMRHELTLLAYEMNDAPLSVPHGAPLRLRCENELGFKMVKWIQAIEFVSDFRQLGAGFGGYNEDHEFYG